MPIELSIETEGAPENLEAFLNEVFSACCQVEGIRDMSAAGRVVDDETIRLINREFRGIDRATDVLSFPSIAYPAGKTARDAPGRLRREGRYLGDFVLSLPHAQSQALEFGHSPKRELGYLTAHSIFHLCGYDHMTDADKARMREMEERAMALMGLRREEEEITMTDQELFDRAVRAIDRAYAPYSDFRVGACLLCADGRAYDGCNIENASLGATICAERCAMCKAVSDGAREFTALAVAGEKGVAAPCGICRQALNEFASGDLRVLFGSKDGRYTETTLRALLPEAFGPQNLQ